MRRILVVALAAATALVVGGGPAYAGDEKPGPDRSMPAEPVPGGFRSWADLIETQERLHGAAQRLQDGLAGLDGFTGIEAAPEDGRVRLHWHGEPSDAVRRLVAEVERDVPVELAAARHSLRELTAAQAAIAAEAGVGAVVAHVDGSGLTVRYRGSEAEARALASIREARVGVSVEAYSNVEPLGCTGRHDDCSPYWGGAKYFPGWCSTGFSLKFTSFLLPGGSTWYRMLSAGHCASNGNAVTDGGGEAVGTIVSDSDAADLLMISPNSGVSLAGRVYVGGWNASTASSKAVNGAVASFSGQWVCTTGAATGEHCNVKVTATNVIIWGTVKTVEVKEQANLVAGGKGDSGGPVVATLFGGKVNAKGTISGGSGQVACPAGSPSSMCFKTLYYVDILTALDHYKPLFGSVGVMTA